MGDYAKDPGRQSQDHQTAVRPGMVGLGLDHPGRDERKKQGRIERDCGFDQAKSDESHAPQDCNHHKRRRGTGQKQDSKTGGECTGGDNRKKEHTSSNLQMRLSPGHFH